jgi:PAS domain S-box-containing protein
MLMSNSINKYAEDLLAIKNEYYCVVTVGGYFVELSSNWVDLLGWSLEELKSKPFTEFVHEDDRNPTSDETQKNITHNRPIKYINRYIKKNGDYASIEWHAQFDQEQQLFFCSCRDVTQEQIKNNVFDQLQELAKVGYWRVDVKTNTAHWSDMTYEIHEVEPGTPIKVEDGINFYVEEHRPLIQKCVEEGITQNKSWDVELKILTTSGSEKWVRAIGYPIIVGGELLYLEGTFQDIDEKRKQLVKIEDQNDHLNMLHNALSSFAIVAETDLDGTIIDVNELFCEVSGYSREELIGQNHRMVNSGHHPKAFFEEMWQTIKAKMVWRDTIKNITKTGEHYWVDTTIVPKLFIGEIVGYISYRIEVTDQKKHEEELQNINFRLLEAQRVADIGNWTYDYETETVMWSEHMKSMFGVKLHEDAPSVKDQYKSIHPEDRDLWMNSLNQCRVSGETFSMRYRVNLPWKDLWFETIGEPILDRNGLVVGLKGTCQNVTKMMQKQVELEKARNTAVQSVKAKDNFLATMSHEIRTPLNGILTVAELLLENNLDDHVLNQLSIIKESGVNLLNILNDILDFSKIESGKLFLEKRSVDVHKLMKTTGEVYQSLANVKGVQLVVDIDSSVPVALHIDELRFKQLLMNLVSNALKFTSKGTITISLHFENEILEVSVKDTGVGIDQDKLDTIFKPFYQEDSTTTRKYGGTGLGLSIVQKIVDVMKGFIAIESEKGVGTTIKLKIPTKEVELVTEENIEYVEDKQSFENLRVLVAEDNIMNQKVIEKILEKESIEFDIVPNGKQAVQLVQDEQYDLVLMDMQMPVMDGVEATKEIRKFNSMINIVALTANAYKEDEKKCLDAGMNDFLSKPINIKKLRSIFIRVSEAQSEKKAS